MTRPHITTDQEAAAARVEIDSLVAANGHEAADGSTICHLYDRLDKYESDVLATARKVAKAGAPSPRLMDSFKRAFKNASSGATQPPGGRHGL